MDYTYCTDNKRKILCIIDKIFEEKDSVTIYAKEHPQNNSLTITNSVEYLIKSFEDQYKNKKIYICYEDSYAEKTVAEMVEGKLVFH